MFSISSDIFDFDRDYIEHVKCFGSNDIFFLLSREGAGKEGCLQLRGRGHDVGGTLAFLSWWEKIDTLCTWPGLDGTRPTTFPTSPGWSPGW